MRHCSKTIGDFLVRSLVLRSERLLASMAAWMAEIIQFGPTMRTLTDTALGAKTQEFRNRLADALHGRQAPCEEPDRALDNLLSEAFAVAGEASARVLGAQALQSRCVIGRLDAQMLGGMALHRSMITEMPEDEVKPLVASTLAAYLNAHLGKGVHIVTANDSLALGKCHWLGPLFEFLGLTVGVIHNQQELEPKREAYQRDITFGKDSEFAFDYLRDTLRPSTEERVQGRVPYYAIIDKPQSLLIDEARTPLMITADGADGEVQLLAKVTYQDFFQRYEKLAGQTGIHTADAGEFHKRYKLGVVTIERMGTS
jgi:preprotein translocase subunit SecA